MLSHNSLIIMIMKKKMKGIHDDFSFAHSLHLDSQISLLGFFSLNSLLSYIIITYYNVTISLIKHEIEYGMNLLRTLYIMLYSSILIRSLTRLASSALTCQFVNLSHLSLAAISRLGEFYAQPSEITIPLPPKLYN